MSDYHYLIIGGGMAAYAAIQGVRAVDPERSIGLISAESHPPYKRPPLSKGLWQGTPIERIWYSLDELGVMLHLGRSVQTLMPSERTVVDDRGDHYHYEKLLIASGGHTVKLPFGEDEIIYFRNLDDYLKLKAFSERKQRFAVIGGGFIGSEITSALAGKGKQVVMLFPEDGIGASLFPNDLSQFLNDYFRANGVEVLSHQLVTGLERKEESLCLSVRDSANNGERIIDVDAVVAGIGIRPNVSFAESAGLAVDNGIVVDEFLRAGESDIYAAGDVANFLNHSLGVRMRAEHEDNALMMGECAGRNMAGEVRPYHHLPYFYSDFFGLGYEAVGKMSSRLETVADWIDPYKKGVIYYLENQRVCGVLLWDVWERLDAARAMITEPGPFTAADLKGKLTV
ncbi:MAG: NAD(P)/FAD-dependent oxidoreductase [Gammaproteobacteria bacterium]